jgi:hypothetical protein
MSKSDVKIMKIKELDPDIIPPITKRFRDPNYNGGSKIVVVGKPGCFAAGTKIMMYDGSFKNIEDVQIGDQVMGDDSNARNVLDLCNNFETMYKVIPNKGDTYTVNENHILSLKCTGYNEHRKGELIDITVKEFLKKSKTFRERYKWYRTGVNFDRKMLDIDPYLLGYWLGDGTASCAQITTADKEVVEAFKSKLPDNLIFNKAKALYRYQIKSDKLGKGNNTFLNSLRSNNLIKNKHIPLNFKTGSEEQRLQLLAGIVDSDGHYDKKGNCYDVVQKSEKLLDDIIFVARSLGFSAYKKCCTKTCTNSAAGNHSGTYYRCCISGEISKIPCVVERKKADESRRNKDVLVTGFKLEKLDRDEYFGFELDGNHRFLGGDFTVLHNTGKSTLIKALLYSKKHIFPVGMAMSGSEDSNHAYKQMMPNSFVFNEYDEEKIKDFIKRQKLASDHLQNPWAVLILDDCTDDPRLFNKPLQQALYKKGRHWKMMYILSLQYAMDVKPVIRTNVDGIFILREPLLKNRESLYKNYASIVPDFGTFCQLMDQLTDDYCALYIHGATQTNEWQDCVFYWKAPVTPANWRFGSADYWAFHKARFNQNYVEKHTII